MKSAPHLMFVVNTDWFFLSHRLPIALEALRRGFRVSVASPDTGASSQIRGYGIAFHHIPMSRAGMNPLREAETVCRLANLYRARKPDLVHHVTLKPVLYGTMAARLTGVPAVVNAVSGLGYLYAEGGALHQRLLTALLRVVLRHSNSQFIFQNPDDAAFFLNNGIASVPDATLIRGSGVNLNRFTASLEPDLRPVVAVLPTRMLWSKGVGVFAEAARLLRRMGEANVRLVLVGQADPENPDGLCKEQLEEIAGQGAVEWWGFQEDMPSVLKGAHIVVFPSHYGEGVPKVLIEAAAAGRPIITTNTPGCREVVEHGKNGLLVPARDPVALSEAIRTLAGDAQMRARMGRHGRGRAEEEFGVRQVTRKTLAVYDALLPARLNAEAPLSV